MSTLLTGLCLLFVLVMILAGAVWLVETVPVIGIFGFIILGAAAIAAVSSMGSRN